MFSKLVKNNVVDHEDDEEFFSQPRSGRKMTETAYNVPYVKMIADDIMNNVNENFAVLKDELEMFKTSKKFFLKLAKTEEEACERFYNSMLQVSKTKTIEIRTFCSPQFKFMNLMHALNLDNYALYVWVKYVSQATKNTMKYFSDEEHSCDFPSLIANICASREESYHPHLIRKVQELNDLMEEMREKRLKAEREKKENKLQGRAEVVSFFLRVQLETIEKPKMATIRHLDSDYNYAYFSSWKTNIRLMRDFTEKIGMKITKRSEERYEKLLTDIIEPGLKVTKLGFNPSEVTRTAEKMMVAREWNMIQKRNEMMEKIFSNWERKRLGDIIDDEERELICEERPGNNKIYKIFYLDLIEAVEARISLFLRDKEVWEKLCEIEITKRDYQLEDFTRKERYPLEWEDQEGTITDDGRSRVIFTDLSTFFRPETPGKFDERTRREVLDSETIRDFITERNFDRDRRTIKEEVLEVIDEEEEFSPPEDYKDSKTAEILDEREKTKEMIKNLTNQLSRLETKKKEISDVKTNSGIKKIIKKTKKREEENDLEDDKSVLIERFISPEDPRDINDFPSQVLELDHDSFLSSQSGGGYGGNSRLGRSVNLIPRERPRPKRDNNSFVSSLRNRSRSSNKSVRFEREPSIVQPREERELSINDWDMNTIGTTTINKAIEGMNNNDANTMRAANLTQLLNSLQDLDVRSTNSFIMPDYIIERTDGSSKSTGVDDDTASFPSAPPEYSEQTAPSLCNLQNNTEINQDARTIELSDGEFDDQPNTGLLANNLVHSWYMRRDGDTLSSDN